MELQRSAHILTPRAKNILKKILLKQILKGLCIISSINLFRLKVVFMSSTCCSRLLNVACLDLVHFTA